MTDQLILDRNCGNQLRRQGEDHLWAIYKKNCFIPTTYIIINICLFKITYSHMSFQPKLLNY
jgi:hypothetical protein